MERISFKPITISDKEIITSYTMPGNFRNCDFSFANMCSWRFLYNSEYAIEEDTLLIRFKIDDDRPAYMVPIGRNNLRRAVEQIEQDSLLLGHPLCILGVTPDCVETLNELFPDEFRFIPERDYFDYIYLREDLVYLRGKKFQPKRNHINKFRNEYDFTYTPITPDSLYDCLELEAQWCIENGCIENSDLQNERKSMSYALLHFEELGLMGGAIRIDGRIAAFSYGMPINHDTFGVHVEKADTTIDGIYAIMNQQFAEHIPESFTYVNREEDLGIPGLRKAKLSYQPAILLEKSAAIKHRKS